MILAVVIAAILIIAAILAIAAVSAASREAHGRHAIRAGQPFADPADVSDPEGIRFIAELHHEPLPLPVLARVLGKLRELDTVARFTPAPGCGDAEYNPDITVRLPHAQGTWGMTPAEKVDELARIHMEMTK